MDLKTKRHFCVRWILLSRLQSRAPLIALASFLPRTSTRIVASLVWPTRPELSEVNYTHDGPSFIYESRFQYHLFSLAVAKVALGSRHTCASMVGGDVKCWGKNDASKLRDGFSQDKETMSNSTRRPRTNPPPPLASTTK